MLAQATHPVLIRLDEPQHSTVRYFRTLDELDAHLAPMAGAMRSPTVTVCDGFGTGAQETLMMCNHRTWGGIRAANGLMAAIEKAPVPRLPRWKRAFFWAWNALGLPVQD